VPEIYPFLAVKDVDAAVAFYAKAFGATEERERVIAPDGAQVALLLIEGQRVGVATEHLTSARRAPRPLVAQPSALPSTSTTPMSRKPVRWRREQARCFRSLISPMDCDRDAWLIHSGTTG
jgi:catechol 2,3-dioxygenase-like lactoylglutathione lyase family enzyme